jgi:5-oxoprolinase (ATP-hydrolysing) subunit C
LSGREAGLRVLEPGLFSTVQDLGRPGYRRFGVPLSGAFDVESHTIANALVGNPPEAATIEMTLRGGRFEADGGPLALAIAGAPMHCRLDVADCTSTNFVPPRSFTLAAGDRLQVGGCERGARAYLAVARGWQTDLILGSRSSETKLEAGAIVFASASRISSSFVRCASQESSTILRIFDGPDSSSVEKNPLIGSPYRVAVTSNRMGIRLEGLLIELAIAADRLSTPVAPGAIQIAGGQPIILGVASGTLGGYPHCAHVVSADLSRVAQLRPGDDVEFNPIGWDEAVDLDRRTRGVLGRRAKIICCHALDVVGHMR